MPRKKSSSSVPKAAPKAAAIKPPAPIKEKKVANLVPKIDPAEVEAAEEANDKLEALQFLATQRYNTQLSIYCAIISNPGRGWNPKIQCEQACVAADMFLEEAGKHI